MKKINIAVIGLRFGGYFVPIYLDHPNVGNVTICDTDVELLEKLTNKYENVTAYKTLDEVLGDESIDAVHITTPIPFHADQSVAVLESGKHCACTVPMATSLEDIKRITEAKRKSGKKYMMMETTLYTYQFFYVKEMIEKGELGRIQFMRGSHYQDMRNWPEYWLGLPPMWYGTHAIGPMVALSGSRIKRVNCFGSGTMDESLQKRYNNPFPIESALFEFENGLKGEATRSLFETARAYQEGMFIYGSEASFEWGFDDGSDPYITHIRIRQGENSRGSDSIVEQKKMPNYYKLLPEEIQQHTIGSNLFDPLNPHKSLETGGAGAHHGSHPHLVHEFVMSIIENRKPLIDEILGANITAAGICAHESAMKNGEAVIIPEF